MLLSLSVVQEEHISLTPLAFYGREHQKTMISSPQYSRFFVIVHTHFFFPPHEGKKPEFIVYNFEILVLVEYKCLEGKGLLHLCNSYITC